MRWAASVGGIRVTRSGGGTWKVLLKKLKSGVRITFARDSQFTFFLYGQQIVVCETFMYDIDSVFLFWCTAGVTIYIYFKVWCGQSVNLATTHRCTRFTLFMLFILFWLRKSTYHFIKLFQGVTNFYHEMFHSSNTRNNIQNLRRGWGLCRQPKQI